MDVYGAFIVKMKINEIGVLQIDSFRNIWNYVITFLKSWLAVSGAVCILLSPFPYAVALSRMEVSVVYPVTVAFNFILLIPIAIIFLGETFSLNKFVGLILIMISLYLLYR